MTYSRISDVRSVLKDDQLPIQSELSGAAAIGFRRNDSTTHVWRPSDLFAQKAMVCRVQLQSMRLHFTDEESQDDRVHTLQLFVGYAKQRISGTVVNMSKNNRRRAFLDQGGLLTIKDISKKLKDNEELSIADDHALVIGVNQIDMTDDSAKCKLVGQQLLSGGDLRMIQKTQLNLTFTFRVADGVHVNVKVMLYTSSAKLLRNPFTILSFKDVRMFNAPRSSNGLRLRFEHNGLVCQSTDAKLALPDEASNALASYLLAGDFTRTMLLGQSFKTGGANPVKWEGPGMFNLFTGKMHQLLTISVLDGNDVIATTDIPISELALLLETRQKSEALPLSIAFSPGPHPSDLKRQERIYLRLNCVAHYDTIAGLVDLQDMKVIKNKF